MVGRTLKELGIPAELEFKHYAVKEAVLPFIKFSGVDTLLGPEMKSTGEVMGIDHSFGLAFAKSQLAANSNLPSKGKVLISVNDKDKGAILPIARRLRELGFDIAATRGTAAFLSGHSFQTQLAYKVNESRPDIVDHVKNGEIALIINTPLGKTSVYDELAIRRAAVDYRIPYITTIAGAEATVSGLEAMSAGGLTVKSIQEYNAAMA
jgi:carbamoyl-phosphate synthase large subunit